MRTTLKVLLSLLITFLLIPQVFSQEAKVIKGGVSTVKATNLAPGSYLVSADARVKAQYFYVSTLKGERAIVAGTFSNAEKHAPFKLTAYAPNGKVIPARNVEVPTLHNQLGEVSYVDTTGRGFYFRMDIPYSAKHLKSQIDVRIEHAFDIKKGLEAPEKSGKKSIPIVMNHNYQSHLGLDDRADSYRYKGKRPAVIDIEFVDPSFRFEVVTRDAKTKKRLIRYMKLRGSASLPLADTKNDIYIEVIDTNGLKSKYFSKYTLLISKFEA